MSARDYIFQHTSFVNPRPGVLNDYNFVSLEVDDTDYVEKPPELDANQSYFTFSPSEIDPVEYWAHKGHEEDPNTYVDLPLWEDPREIPGLAGNHGIEEDMKVYCMWDNDGELMSSEEKSVRELLWSQARNSELEMPASE